MQKYFILILVLILNFSSATALEIVYPKTNPVTINASSTFFIGSTNPRDTLKINDIEVKLSPSGAFAQTVPLAVGKNNFEIMSYPSHPSYSYSCPCQKDNAEANVGINFLIVRPEPIASAKNSPQLIEYPVMSNFYVINDNAPLRMTPVDSGINRMSHLQKDVRLLVNGEKGNFYRVYLNSQSSGWIAKSDVEQKENIKNESKSVTLKEYKAKEENDFCLYEFDLSEKTPFTLKEENGLTLKLFNIEGQVDNTYCLNIPVRKLMGYEAYYDNDKFILKVRKFPNNDVDKPLKGLKIVVDAGHGGKEFGAIGGCGHKEKDINLFIAKKLQRELTNRGVKVIMTREEDVDLSLTDRVKIAKDKDAALLISIHANALSDGADPLKNRGTSVYYYHNQAKPLAESILASMTCEIGTQNDKIRQGSLALVRPTSSVSVLIEVAYMINPDDYECLLNNDFQTNCAKAIADGIENFIKN